jgi:hypothetical protein
MGNATVTIQQDKAKIVVYNADVIFTVKMNNEKVNDSNGSTLFMIHHDPTITIQCSNFTYTKPVENSKHKETKKKELFAYRFWRWFYSIGKKAI